MHLCCNRMFCVRYSCNKYQVRFKKHQTPPSISSHENMRVLHFYIPDALIRRSLIQILKLWHVASIGQFECLWVPVVFERTKAQVQCFYSSVHIRVMFQ